MGMSYEFLVHFLHDVLGTLRFLNKLMALALISMNQNLLELELDLSVFISSSDHNSPLDS